MKTLFDMSQKQKRKMNRSGKHISCQSYCYHKEIKKNYLFCSFSYVFVQKKSQQPVPKSLQNEVMFNNWIEECEIISSFNSSNNIFSIGDSQKV